MIHGRLNTGEPFAFETRDHPRIGTCDGDGWWAKALLGDNQDRLLLSQKEGFEVRNRIVPA